MSLIRVNINTCQRLFACRYVSNVSRHEDEYSATPNYPPIQDLSIVKKRERQKDSVYDEIKAVKTIEEKQIKLNMPKYYGFKTYLFYENKCGYNSLPLAQHATRTHLTVNKSLPDYYNELNADDIVNKIKLEVEEAILTEIDGYQRLHDLKNNELTQEQIEDTVGSSITKQLNRIITNELASSYVHLKEAQVTVDPRIESTWLVGGIDPPERVRKSKEAREYLKEFANDPYDRVVTYIGSPSFIITSKLPLKPIISHSKSEDVDLKVPEFNYDPRTVGTVTDYRHMTNIPGYWPGEVNKYGILSYHHRGYTQNYKNVLGIEEEKEILHRQGIISSFGWLQAQANFMGFNTFNDITVPLVTQTIITNGKLWSFYVYQLNTILFNERFFTNNPKKNICWGTEEMNLYEEINNGKLIGFNEDVLKMLLKLYINQPEDRLGVNLTPYLNNTEKVCADYEEDEKRVWLEENYKYLMSNRPRHLLTDEIYSWEKIYKIDNKTRFMDKKLRPFELSQNPFQRKLNERCPKYVPKKFREDVKKVKGGAHKFAKDYFP